MPDRLQNCGTCEITLNLGATKVQSVVKGTVNTQLVTSVGCALLELSPFLWYISKWFSAAKSIGYKLPKL